MSIPSVTLTKTPSAVTLTVSARIANNLTDLQSALKSAASRLGHPACFSGCDSFHIGQEREFIVLGGAGASVELNPQPLPPRLPPPALGSGRPVTVALADSVANDINALTKAVSKVVAKLGCASCCSGFDIEFHRELDLITVDKELNVQGIGRFH